MTVTLTQFDVEGATVHDNLGLTTSTTCDEGCDGSCTGTCTTGLCDTAATLPYTSTDNIIIRDTGKFDIAALREGGVMFQKTTRLTHLVYIVCEDDIMRIAH